MHTCVVRAHDGYGVKMIQNVTPGYIESLRKKSYE